MDWIIETLEHFFLLLSDRIDAFIDMFSFMSGTYNLGAFLSYIWYLCIPNEITDIVIFGICILFFFALSKYIK